MKLRTYVIRRIILFIPIFFLVSVIIFSLIHLAPGDPITFMFGATRPGGWELQEMMTKKYGLDKPLYTQYFIWLSGILHGDFGHSYISNRPVIKMIGERLWPTLELVIIAQVFALIVSITLGAMSAVKRYSILDNVCTFFALLGRAMPNFWIALNLIILFSLTLRWLPVTGTMSVGVTFSSPFEAWVDHVKHLILPLVSLMLYYVGYLFRIVRASMLEVLEQDYIITARAKGLKENIVIYKHALRNALLPTVTIVGIFMGYLFSGSAVIETIFAWPGLGNLMINITFNREYLALMSLCMIIVVMVLVANLITDIAYAVLDPRIRY